MVELIAEGLLGDNLDFKWKFTSDGTLTILGEGVLKFSKLPDEWKEELANSSKFLRVVYSEGITEIVAHDIAQYTLPTTTVLELPSTLYYINGYIGRNPIVLFLHAKVPPKGGNAILAKVVYVPYESVDIYTLAEYWEHVIAMPPIFDPNPFIAIYSTNCLDLLGHRVSVYSIDGNLVLMSSGRELIKKAGDYIAVAYDGRQQRFRILADYVEPQEKKS